VIIALVRRFRNTRTLGGIDTPYSCEIKVSCFTFKIACCTIVGDWIVGYNVCFFAISTGIEKAREAIWALLTGGVERIFFEAFITEPNTTGGRTSNRDCSSITWHLTLATLRVLSRRGIDQGSSFALRKMVLTEGAVGTRKTVETCPKLFSILAILNSP